MNEFTKEELQYLFRTFMLTNGDDFEHNLESKMQRMIDNYCDHEESEANHNYEVCKCKKCGELFI